MSSKVSSAIAAFALVLASSGLTAMATSPASAAVNPPCMSRAEYRAIKVGMPLIRVRAIVGSRGKNSMQSSYMSIWQWKVCTNPYGVGTVAFVRGRVDNKSYIG